MRRSGLPGHGDLHDRPGGPVSGMGHRAARGPGPPPALPGLPLLLLLALAARGVCTAPALRAEDLSLGVVSARPGTRVPRPGGPHQCAPKPAGTGAPWTHFLGRKLRLGRRLSD